MNQLINIATRAAERSLLPMRMGAVVSYRNRPISFGFNKGKTHPRSKTIYRTIHAELDAVLGMRRSELRGATITVVRISRRIDTVFGISRPCCYCIEMLRELRFDAMQYYDRMGKFCSEAL
jgi:cytidine deaminase